MSGRGRGRGRGGAGQVSAAKLLLRRSAQEAGLDDRNLRTLEDITRPALFPDFHFHSNGGTWSEGDISTKKPAAGTTAKRSTQTLYLIKKGREIHHRMNSSAHYVRPTQEVDVVRYSRQRQDLPPDKHVLEQVGHKLANDPRFTPQELLAKKDRTTASGSSGKRKAPLSLDELVARERSGTNNEEEGEGEEGGNLSDTPEDEEEEEVADYTANYYATDDETDDDDGGEATF